MKIALLTDAWLPQVNGVVTTLLELVQELEAAGHEVQVLHPGQFATRPCPGYPGIDLAVRPAKRVTTMLDAMKPDAIHLATEGPLGWAGRRYCLRKGLAFTTAFHTRFPEILHAALRVPLRWGYALFRHFHQPSSGVMVPTQGVLQMLERRGFRNLRPWTHGVDTRAFPFHGATIQSPLTGALAHPVSLYVGRISYEKNIEAFLLLDIPGSKVVCGVGPLEARLKAKYRRSVGWASWTVPRWRRYMRLRMCLCFPAGQKPSAWSCWRQWPAGRRWPPTLRTARWRFWGRIQVSRPEGACCTTICSWQASRHWRYPGPKRAHGHSISPGRMPPGCSSSIWFQPKRRARLV